MVECDKAGSDSICFYSVVTTLRKRRAARFWMGCVSEMEQDILCDLLEYYFVKYWRIQWVYRRKLRYGRKSAQKWRRRACLAPKWENARPLVPKEKCWELQLPLMSFGCLMMAAPSEVEEYIARFVRGVPRACRYVLCLLQTQRPAGKRELQELIKAKYSKPYC